jgi:hypothetical protein
LCIQRKREEQQETNKIINSFGIHQEALFLKN